MRNGSSNMNGRGVGSMVMLAAGVLGCVGASEAAYMGMTVVSAGDHMVNGALRTSWRVYVVFSDAGDHVCAVAGSPTLGNLVIQTLSSNVTAPGGNFVNVGGPGTITAPLAADVLETPDLQWDSFIDIGFAIVPDGLEDDTMDSPGFTGIGDVAQINTNNAGWYTHGPMYQTMAGNGVANVDGLGNWGVIIMQLTVDAGNHVAGTTSVWGLNANQLSGSTTFGTMADQTFSSFPAPGSLAVLGLAGVMSRRRRR